MAATPCVVLCGNSVFLAGIKADLERKAHEYGAALQLVTVEAGSPNVTGLIRASNPRAVLFDLAAEEPGFAATLLREQPGLLLIGVDPSSDELLVLSVRRRRALSLTDLADVIYGQEPNSEPFGIERKEKAPGKARSRTPDQAREVVQGR